MYLQVPVKLERYIDEIKSQTKRLTDRKKVTLLQIGKSKTNETYKIMMLVYNPYSNPIHITPNLFTSEHSIYKMYPSEFKIGADTVSAFVLFTTKDVKISINEEQLLNNIKSEIETVLRQSNYYENTMEQIEVHQVLKINPLELQLDQTINLGESIDKQFDTITFTSKEEQYVSIAFNDIIETEKASAIELNIINKDEIRNILINGLNLKLSDRVHKMHIAIEQPIMLKAASSKNVRIYVNKIELSLINRENLEIKATIL